MRPRIFNKNPGNPLRGLRSLRIPRHLRRHNRPFQQQRQPIRQFFRAFNIQFLTKPKQISPNQFLVFDADLADR
jgi:hypothetical protein